MLCRVPPGSGTGGASREVSDWQSVSSQSLEAPRPAPVSGRALRQVSERLPLNRRVHQLDENITNYKCEVASIYCNLQEVKGILHSAKKSARILGLVNDVGPLAIDDAQMIDSMPSSELIDYDRYRVVIDKSSWIHVDLLKCVGMSDAEVLKVLSKVSLASLSHLAQLATQTHLSHLRAQAGAVRRVRRRNPPNTRRPRRALARLLFLLLSRRTLPPARSSPLPWRRPPCCAACGSSCAGRR